MAHLARFGIDEDFLNENIIFLDDFIDNPDEFFGNVESVGLIDWNKLPKDINPILGQKVHYIIDHHNDNQMYLNSLIEKRI